MTIELKMLLYATILLILQLIFQVLGEIIQNGLGYALSARDEDPESGGYSARFERAFYNMLETYPAFAALVFLLYATDSWSSLTALGAQLYFWARVVYVPAYVSGIPVVRTAIWATSLAGILMMAWQLLSFATA
ncbi:MAG: MAPEG family protein [Nitratireductor sp.]|jgi:uncharacterized MAPEG superfamily protein|nr:MAPEG family protein [Nitratireductor sp.]